MLFDSIRSIYAIRKKVEEEILNFGDLKVESWYNVTELYKFPLK